MIEDGKIYFFRVGKAQYIYGKNSKQEKPYYCMKYKDSWAIDTGRRIFETTMPGRLLLNVDDPKNISIKKVEDEYMWFSSEEELYEKLDEIGSDNLDHVMWGLTPEKWIKPVEMKQPVGFSEIFKSDKNSL